MYQNTKEQIFEFLKNYRVLENLALILTFLCLFIPFEILEIKCKFLISANGNKWCLELFIYSTILLALVFFWQLLLNVFVGINLIQFKLLEQIKRILFLNRYISIIAIFIILIITIVLLYFTYKLEIGNYENMLAYILLNGLFLFFILGIINLGMSLIFIIMS